jgi:general secretion pathway protein L
LTEALLLFLGREGGFDGWLLLSDGAVAARGPELEALPARGKGARVIAVVPGEQVTLHWLDLPSGLAPAQAQAAARLLAAELSADAMTEIHVAVGREEAAGVRRCVALVPAARIAEWLSRLQERRFDPDHIVPETLLLPPPAEGVLRFGRGGTSLYRGDELAFAMEPELAEMVVAGQPVVDVDPAWFEAQLDRAVSSPALDLRQGPFARRRSFKLERRRVRTLALLIAGILLLTLLIQIVTLFRYTYAADALEAETKRLAATALPRGASLDPSRDLGRRIEELRGGGAGYGATASAVFAAIRATPNVELAALSFASDGSLRATVQGDTPASLAALVARIEEAGFTVASGPPRSGGGRQIGDLMVRAR